MFTEVLRNETASIYRSILYILSEHSKQIKFGNQIIAIRCFWALLSWLTFFFFPSVYPTPSIAVLTPITGLVCGVGRIWAVCWFKIALSLDKAHPPALASHVSRPLAVCNIDANGSSPLPATITNFSHPWNFSSPTSTHSTTPNWSGLIQLVFVLGWAVMCRLWMCLILFLFLYNTLWKRLLKLAPTYGRPKLASNIKWRISLEPYERVYAAGTKCTSGLHPSSSPPPRYLFKLVASFGIQHGSFTQSHQIGSWVPLLSSSERIWLRHYTAATIRVRFCYVHC